MSTQEQTRTSTTTSSAPVEDPTAFVRRLPRGKYGGLVCTECNQEVHRDYNPDDTGFLSYKKEAWYCHGFCSQLEDYREHNAPYDNPAYRSQYAEVFSKYLKNEEGPAESVKITN